MVNQLKHFNIRLFGIGTDTDYLNTGSVNR